MEFSIRAHTFSPEVPLFKKRPLPYISYFVQKEYRIPPPPLGKKTDLQAHSVTPSAALRACKSAVFA